MRINSKTWALADGDEIVYQANTKQEVLEYAWYEDMTRDDVTLIALPQPHKSMFI